MKIIYQNGEEKAVVMRISEQRLRERLTGEFTACIGQSISSVLIIKRDDYDMVESRERITIRSKWGEYNKAIFDELAGKQKETA